MSDFVKQQLKNKNEDINNQRKARGPFVACMVTKMSEKQKYYVTTAIAYASKKPHFGNTYEAIMTDAIVRLLPGAIGDETSALSDSFQDGLLEPGVYTRPAEYKGWRVPEILLSGHQAKIEEWLYEESVRHTQERRPDLLEEEC